MKLAKLRIPTLKFTAAQFARLLLLVAYLVSGQAGGRACFAKSIHHVITQPSNQVQEITLRFPAVAVGGLYICPRDTEESDSNPFGAARREAIAVGTVKLKLLPTECVLLELNPDTLKHPERLKQIDPAHIERLKASYLNMEDEQSSVMDRVLTFVPHLKNLFSVDFSGSDITDVGLKELRLLPKLKSINCMNTAIKGRTFGELKALKNLELIDVTNVRCAANNFDGLGLCKALRSLHLRNCRMNNESLSFLPGLDRLFILDIGKNPAVTDGALPILCKMKGLRMLLLNGTKISATGLLKSGPETLQRLELPSPASPQITQSLKNKLRKNSPRVWSVRERINDDELKMFAPESR